MTTLDPTALENRCSEHLAEIDAKAKRKPVYVPIPKVELPDSAKERAKLWDDCVLETALGLRHLIYSDDPETVRWALEQLVALEKTSLRHNRRLAGTERPEERPPLAVTDFSPIPPLDPLDLPIRSAPKTMFETAMPEDDFPPAELSEAAARPQTEALERHIDAAHTGLIAAVDELELDAKNKARVKSKLPRQWAGWLVNCKLMHEEAMPGDLDGDYFRRLNCRGPLMRYLKHAGKSKEELLRGVFGDYADQLLEVEATEERKES